MGLIGCPDGWFAGISVVTFAALVVAVRRLMAQQKRRIETVLASAIGDAEKQAVLYASGQDELRFTKTQQWNMTYYVLLVYGVIYAMETETKKLGTPFITAASVALYILNCAAFIFGFYMTLELQYKLREHRINIDKTNYYKAGYYENGKFNSLRFELESGRDKEFWRDPRITAMLLAANAIGFLIVALATWNTFAKLIGAALKRLHA